MSLYWVAFVIGVMGSLHCVGMCGPLVLSIPAPFNNLAALLGHKLLYHLGRSITYCLLGVTIGYFGYSIQLFSYQRGLSVASGIFITLIAVHRLLPLKWNIFQKFNTSISDFVGGLIGKALQKSWGHLLLGFFNGLLPCGFVYLALVASLNTSNAIDSALFMFCFGLGTFPLMLLLSISPRFLKANWRNQLSKYSSYLALIIGLLFIFRGLDLGIPYLSPSVNQPGVICH